MDPTPTRRDPPRWLNPLAWVLLPLFVLATLETALGRTGLVYNRYSRVEAVARERHIDYLFLGTSRTWAALDTVAFADEVRAHTGRDVFAEKAGIGNSTNAQHLRGLRNVLRAAPDALRGSVVFLEARAGVPGAERGRDLRNELGAGALEDVFRLEDLPALLAADLPEEGAQELEDKASVLLAWAAPPLRTVQFRGRIRRKLLERAERALRATHLFGAPPRKRRVNLADGGGLRDDPEGLEAVRRQVSERLDALIARQEPIDWEHSDLLEIVDLVQRAGARVAVLELPLCSPDRRRWTSELRRADAARIAGLLAARDVAHVDAGIEVPDTDFPDNLHVNLEQAERFSRAAARAWLAVEAGDGPR